MIDNIKFNYQGYFIKSSLNLQNKKNSTTVNFQHTKKSEFWVVVVLGFKDFWAISANFITIELSLREGE